MAYLFSGRIQIRRNNIQNKYILSFMQHKKAKNNANESCKSYQIFLAHFSHRLLISSYFRQCGINSARPIYDESCDALIRQFRNHFFCPVHTTLQRNLKTQFYLFCLARPTVHTNRTFTKTLCTRGIRKAGFSFSCRQKIF